MKTTNSSANKKKPSGSSGKSSASWAILFWLVFIIFIFGLFIFNREAITSSINAIRNETTSRETPAESSPLTESPPAEPAVNPTDRTTSVPAPAPQSPVQGTFPAASPETPAQPPSQPPQTQQTEQRPETEQRPAQLRERGLYFTQVDRGGAILRVKVERQLPVSSSPMTDVIHALLSGPNDDEKRRGLISLIPPNTKILSATIRGSTAYISFSEDFQYNTYGAEGYAGQIRQIVFTVTEFPNIRDVQILIEGRRIDYLGEGVWIGSPLSRDML